MTIEDGKYIYWDGQNVIETYCVQETIQASFVIDADFTNLRSRYGNWKSGNWKHVPFDDFPVEFRMALLILGIT